MRIYNFKKTNTWYFIKYSTIILIMLITLFLFQDSGKNMLFSKKPAKFNQIISFLNNDIIKTEEEEDKENDHLCRRVSEYKGNHCTFVQKHCDDSEGM
jgi:hypothetical protein